MTAGLTLGLLVSLTTIGANPASAAEKFRCNGKVATIVIDAGNPDQQGTPGNDVVVIRDGGHDFSGGEGDDSICDESLGLAPNALRGERGDDFFWPSGNEIDTVSGGPGDDEVFGSNGNAHGRTVVNTGRGDDLVTMDAGQFSVDLGPGDDIAEANQAYDSTVVGGLGNDTVDRLTPGDGVDSALLDVKYDGNQGSDALSWREYRRPQGSSSGSVVIDAKAHQATGFGQVDFHSVDRFIGSNQKDQFLGGPGADRFRGLGGNDIMFGRGGPDALYGGAGHDVANGGGDRDICQAERRISCERH